MILTRRLNYHNNIRIKEKEKTAHKDANAGRIEKKSIIIRNLYLSYTLNYKNKIYKYNIYGILYFNIY